MRTMRSVAWLGVLAVLFSAGTALAGTGLVAIDHINGLFSGDSVTAGENLRIVIKMDNTAANGFGVGQKCDVSAGFRILSNDGAVWDSINLDSTLEVDGSSQNKFLLLFSITGVLGQFTHGDGAPTPDSVGTLQSGKAAKAAEQLPTTWNDSVFAINVYFHDKSSAGKHICIDSSFFGTGGTWSWVGSVLVGGNLPVFTPEWKGLTGQVHQDGVGFCFYIFDPTSGVTDRGGSLPKAFSVSQNYPNPFNPTTKIDFEVPAKAQVKLTVYNVLGQRVTTLVDKAMNPGKYVADWDGRSDAGNSVASGIYFYKFEAGSYVVTKKMIMLK